MCGIIPFAVLCILGFGLDLVGLRLSGKESGRNVGDAADVGFGSLGEEDSSRREYKLHPSILV